ncbi:hypothetical protein ZIOFF_007509 [Zingiber officinale]|uniref:Uncharacterized protein n=1 Tax=Zingiber officinale TaxID=94328 RepID=A0A8J5I1X6_ZINOF|nr:hypothetical protein ZIOFF_007509 [Zingiber officinale]
MRREGEGKKNGAAPGLSGGAVRRKKKEGCGRRREEERKRVATVVGEEREGEKLPLSLLRLAVAAPNEPSPPLLFRGRRLQRNPLSPSLKGFEEEYLVFYMEPVYVKDVALTHILAYKNPAASTARILKTDENRKFAKGMEYNPAETELQFCSLLKLYNKD